MRKISGVIITYNNADIIVNCIKSIKWVDELIVVDIGSKDHTLDLVKDFTSNIFSISFVEYVEKVRNFSLRKASGEWIFVIDPDETVPKDAERIIRTLIKDKSYDGYMFPRRNYINFNTYLRFGFFYPDYQLRLFKNKKEIKYSGVIHEQAIINPKKVQKINNLEIYHDYSYSKYDSFFSFHKFFRYIKMEGEFTAKSDRKNLHLLSEILLEFIRNFYRSFIKLSGYKDSYNGFRAAIIYSLYKSSIPLYSFLIRAKVFCKS